MSSRPPHPSPTTLAPVVGGEETGYAVRWHLVVPVKDGALAKTRLAPPAPLDRPVLARAVARDTLEAVCVALPPAQVVVVTSDERATPVATALGATVVPDPGSGLDAAVLTGLRTAEDLAGEDLTGAPDADTAPRGWAVLLGDLPALTPEDLTRALVSCAAYPQAVVPDADGTGTVLLTSTRGLPRPRFGAGSAARHAADAQLLELDLPRLRRDVDTWADLEDAVALGVGRHTRAALARDGGRP